MSISSSVYHEEMWVEASSCKTVVKHSTRNPKVEGLSPALRDKMVKKSKCKYHA